MRGAAILYLCLLPQILAACNCVTSLSACQEVAASNVVFIGTIEAVEPNLLDAWKPHANRNWMQAPELVEVRKDKSEAGLSRLKAHYLTLLPDLPDAEKARILSADTQEELQAVITWIVEQGTKVRFKVRTMFQRKEDSDSDAKENRQPTAKTDSIDIWNESGDCGDAGDDLAYLHFFQHGSGESGRLEGFVTSEVEQLRPDRFHYSGKVTSPVSDVVVELVSQGGLRYTEPDAGGRFVFDGLAEGDYRVSIFELGFPERVHLLSGPKPVHLIDKGCATTALLVLNLPSKKP